MFKGTLLCLVFICLGCNNKKIQKSSKLNKVVNVDREILIYDFETLEPLLYTNSDTTYIINFWAMWCAPCVKELPYFVEYAQKNKDKKIEVIFISLDFPKDVKTKLKPFLEENKMTASEVILLDDADANSWIDRIDPNWSGAIPFTIVFNNKKREFFERSFESLSDLESTINTNFNL